MKKGILKKTTSGSTSGRRARWNEDNLEANEVIKSELNPTKIDEPKTPYHAPIDVDADIEPLDLEDDQAMLGQNDEDDTSQKEALVPSANGKGDFSRQRHKHYDMKAALALGKRLCEEDDEGIENEEGQQTGKDNAASSVTPQPA